MEKVIIFGEGNIQEVAFFYFQKDEKYEVAAFTADIEYIKADTYLGCPMIPFLCIKELYPPEEYKMFIPLGYKRNNHLRAEKYYAAKKMGYDFITYINPKAICYSEKIGENCFILENSVIQPYAQIGNDTILWSGSFVGHHSQIGEHCFVAPYASVSGVTAVGNYTFIGENATVGNDIRIADENIIGAGAVITKNTVEGGVYVPNRSILLDKKSNDISIK